jgi:general secretion pathway protein E
MRDATHVVRMSAAKCGKAAPPDVASLIRATATDALADAGCVAPGLNGRPANGAPLAHDVHAPDFAQDFASFLAGEGIVERSALDRARRASHTTGERFDQVLTKLGLVSEGDLAAGLSKYLSMPLATPALVPPEPVLADRLGPDFVRRNRVMPLALDDGRLAVGVTDPFNDEPIRALAYLTNLTVVPHIFVPADFEKAFDALYVNAADAGALAVHPGAEASEVDVQRLRDMASEAPTIRLVNQIIAQAVETRASDIHVEPNVDTVLVRYRIDGLLRTAQTLAPGLRAAVTSRIKIMAKLDIAERRLPQDGRIKIAVRGVDIDFRISTIPTAFGESVVMRILDRSRVELDFAKLGFSDAHVAAFADLMNQPNGIILVTGPTGSGKTTTLYTALKTLNSSERKIFTVEDPIEYQLAGVNQVQVQPAIGLTFPHALRSILRQDPDIIMIGEIRDLETARIAIQASLTGHLVFSTLHTNSAAATITRLIDMGVENYLIASTVKGVEAQRLVRRLCAHCACPHDGAAYWADAFARDVRGIERFGPADIRQPRGCAQCGGTGFSGRSTIAELLPVDAEIHRLVLAAASDAQIDAAARDGGMISMYANGAGKVWRGETTVEEVLRATRMG